ncbi:MAG: carbohydrate-binding protein [Chitinophagaceae bacterium]
MHGQFTYDPNYRENGKNIYEWMLQFHRNNIGNQPPITYAGGSISISSPTTSALLNGSASWDPDGTITTYSWTKKSGPSQYSINNAAIPSPFLTNLVEGRYVFELTATDNGGAASTDSVVVDVYPAVKNIPGKIQGENYTTMSGVTLETCLDIAGGIDVGGLDMGDWMEYDVNIASAGPYVVKFRVAAFPTGAEIQLKSNGTLIKSFAVPQTGEWQLWTTITDTIQLQSGPQKLRVYSGNTNSWNLNWMEFIAIDQSPTANAGPPQTIITPASATTLNGSGTLTMEERLHLTCGHKQAAMPLQ